MFATKVFILLGLTLAIVNARPNEDFPVFGGVSPITDLSNAERELSASLKALKKGDGPIFEIGKIYSATYQVVAGSSYKIVADLVDPDGKTQKCNVSIWSRSWLKDGIEITFECEGQEKIVRKHSSEKFES